jgi:WD40 repeat protein
MYQNGVAVYSVAWSRTNLLAFGDDTGVVQIWNMQTHQYVRHLVGHQAPVVTMSWSPDDRFLATGSMDFTVRVWLVSTGRTLLVYTHGDVVSTLAWSPNGQYIASGSYDTTVQVWNAQTGQRLLNYQDHTNAVYGLAWSPAGTEIASAGDDGTIQVWKLNGQHVITYLTNATCLAWSPDGQWLVSGSPTGQMMVWRVHGFYG